jgi:hypothetical protein
MTSADQLKALLTEGLACAKQMQLDLERAGEIDITMLQLLWAAARQAAHENRGFVGRLPEGFAGLARSAGFESFPGEVREAEQAVER